MKNFKFSHLLLAVVGVLAFASCQHEHADWAPGAQDSSMGVYFPEIGTYEIKDEATTVTIPVMRMNANDAAEVSFRWTIANLDSDKAEDAAELSAFAVSASTVSFAAESEESSIEVAVDGSKLVMGKKYQLNVKLDEVNASSYAISEATFVVVIPEPWVAYGADEEKSTGIYFDDYFAHTLEDPTPFQGLGTYVLYEKHALNEKRIRAVNVFSPVTLGNIWGEIPEWFGFTVTSEDLTYIEFDTTDPNNVKLVGQSIVDPKGNALVAVPSNFIWSYGGTDYETALVIYDGNPIVLNEGIISMPTEGIFVGAFYGGEYAGYFSEANTSGQMKFYLPGTEFVNYDMVASYDGMYVSADGATAKAIFNFLLGADVASYKFAFAQGDVTADPSATVAAIVEGTEGVKVYESDAETTKWEVELTKGLYTLVAVPYTAEGDARTQDVYTLDFYFNGTGEMPEVEVNVEVGVPSQLVEAERAEEIEAKSPACFSVGVKITADASQLKAIKWYAGDAASVDKAIAGGESAIQALIAGRDASSWIETIKEKGSVVGSFTAIPEAKITVFLRFETIYGTNVDVRCDEYTVPAYDGEFPVGAYKMTEGKNELVFSIIPTSYTNFIWVNDSFDETAWYCTFDAETSILTNTGVFYGYEDEGSQFGGLPFSYANQEQTKVYDYYSSENEKFDPQSALKIELKDGALDLLTYYATPIFNYTQEDQSFTGEYFFLFTPEAKIEPYVEEQPEEQPEAQAFSVSLNAESYAVAAERVEVVKPYNGSFNFRPANAFLK